MKNSLNLLLVLLSIWIGGNPARAAEPVAVAAVNLGFEHWDNGAPVGWVGKSPGYKASSDCAAGPAGRCVLKLESTEATGRGGFIPIAQRIGLGVAAGHQLTLSGMIRTENVAGGGAALWLRADASSGPAHAFDNMGKRAPGGTTGWTRFSVSIAVPRNAAGIVFGVMLSGTGTAWFDDLQLTADQSVNVADAVLSKVKLTPASGYNGVLYIDTVTPPEYR